jgi:hypothetical protein
LCLISSQFGSDNDKALVLVQLPQYMDLQVFVAQKRLTKQFQGILSEITAIALKSNAPETFEAAAATFALCAEKYADLAASAVRESLCPFDLIPTRRLSATSSLRMSASGSAPQPRPRFLWFADSHCFDSW